jgi:hypothetical protein
MLKKSSKLAEKRNISNLKKVDTNFAGPGGKS